MKTKLSFLLLILALSPMPLALSQVPQGFNYQAIARDGSGNVLQNTPLQVMFYVQSLSTGGTLYWKEWHASITTNNFGLFNLVVGNGVRQTASTVATFDLIDWTVTPKYLKTEIYYSSGWHDLGTSQLLTVPYAMVAEDLAGTVKKLSVKGETSGLEEALFEVKNKDGQTVFAVYNEGVRIYVDDGAKGKKGGFAVGGFDMTKATRREYFVVSDDSIRMYLDSNNDTKGKKGGFAVGGFDMTKGTVQNYLDVSADSVRVYIAKTDLKGKKGGFAVGGYDLTKDGKEEYLLITRDSTSIATSNQSKRVTIRKPNETVPLFNIDGSIKMGYDSITSNGIMGYNGTKFLTWEKIDTAWKQFVVTGIPEVITDSVYKISRSSAFVSGNVIKDGGSEIVARGVCWSTSSGPTLMSNSLVGGNGKGHFSVSISGLAGSSTYYLRTFATNSKFTNYGEEKIINTLPPVLPVVSTAAITSITATSATSGGNVSDDGADNITARGVCWNTAGNPLITGDHTTDGSGPGIFTSFMTSLEVNKTYYVKAYATNSVGTVYGEEYSFATTNLPVLSTNPITAVTGTTATTGGNIFAGGELSITARGVCWNTTGNPTLEGSHTENGTGTGAFTSNITGLSLGVTYFVKAYAVNSSGTAYGNEYFFTTLNIPTITTDAVSLVTGVTATCGGSISYNGGAVVTERGLCWNTTGNPLISDSHIDIGEGTGAFSGEITGLTIGTNYYVRAYAINSIGIAYGNAQMFTTQNFASVTTGVVTDITYTTATGGGNITSDGGALITQRGVCWNTSGSPVITENFTNDGTGTGAFTSNFTGLAANNTYYVRAYAINSIGITYGEDVIFSTPTIVPPEPGLPVIGTVIITTNSDGYHTGGYISSDGGTAVTQRGVCWSTSESPTKDDSYTTDGSGIGLFNSLITSFGDCGTTYYIRAYATNSLGTAYGNQLSETSGKIIVITSTTEITDITKTSATSGGTIISDDGCAITERGICWSRHPNPTISNYKALSGNGIGTFTAALTGLYPNDTCHVRAYATNSQGTGYGPEVVFKTEAGTSGVAIGQFYAGGYVFHLDETGDHGLVYAQTGLGGTWGCYGTSVPGTQAGVGTGAANTAIIVANCAEEGIAARLCDDLELNGYTDWFLPSIGELELSRDNLQLGGMRWSSTESSNDAAYYLFSMLRLSYWKYAGFSVDAVRAF